jgi:hypothetical protein
VSLYLSIRSHHLTTVLHQFLSINSKSGKGPGVNSQVLNRAIAHLPVILFSLRLNLKKGERRGKCKLLVTSIQLRHLFSSGLAIRFTDAAAISRNLFRLLLFLFAPTSLPGLKTRPFSLFACSIEECCLSIVGPGKYFAPLHPCLPDQAQIACSGFRLPGLPYMGKRVR